jgi:hypothetical protein
MKSTKHLLDFTPRPKLRLSEIERYIAKHRAITPVPSRRQLISLCEAGEIEGILHGAGKKKMWLVFEDSFLAWLKELDQEAAG